MAHRIYAPGFKDEAVRQVVERGYTVKQVAERLGISEAGLYNWRDVSCTAGGVERVLCVDPQAPVGTGARG